MEEISLLIDLDCVCAPWTERAGERAAFAQRRRLYIHNKVESERDAARRSPLCPSDRSPARLDGMLREDKTPL
jgi:hypothetical protein